MGVGSYSKGVGSCSRGVPWESACIEGSRMFTKQALGVGGALCYEFSIPQWS